VEVIRGWSHRSFPITDPSCIGDARRHCAKAVGEWGWAEGDCGRLSIIVTELGSNLLRHAQEGVLWIAAKAELQEVEILALDKGPGIVDVPHAMQDGVSTGTGSPGNGLGALRRLSDEFDLLSTSEGTICLARVRPPTLPRPAHTKHGARIGAVSLCAPGESVCGDGWAVAITDDQIAVLVADGLGHGPHAAQAAVTAVDVFASAPFAPLASLIGGMHTALQTTRGAAVLAMHLVAPQGVSWCGAGNVAGRLLSGVDDQSLMTQHGTLGIQMRRAEVSRQQRPPHGAVIVYSDGVKARAAATRADFDGCLHRLALWARPG
jgi:anti-sigma regulatory factor (Ser/Thr protein kinase)